MRGDDKSEFGVLSELSVINDGTLGDVEQAPYLQKNVTSMTGRAVLQVSQGQ